ncbi:hypothetical protein GCM10009599_14540 [Luteococcus peritonei]
MDEHGRPVAVELGAGERYVPLAEAAGLMGAPSTAALRNRAYRAQHPEEQGFKRIGGRWYVLVRDPQANGDTTDEQA